MPNSIECAGIESELACLAQVKIQTFISDVTNCVQEILCDFLMNMNNVKKERQF